MADAVPNRTASSLLHCIGIPYHTLRRYMYMKQNQDPETPPFIPRHRLYWTVPPYQLYELPIYQWRHSRRHLARAEAARQASGAHHSNCNCNHSTRESRMHCIASHGMIWLRWHGDGIANLPASPRLAELESGEVDKQGQHCTCRPMGFAPQPRTSI